MPRTSAVTVALLVLLAGCPDFVPWPDESQETPTAIETEFDGQPTPDTAGTDTQIETEAGAEPESLAPGVTADGVANVSLLLDEHYSILERETEDGTYEVFLQRNRTAIELFPFTRRRIVTTRERYVVQFPERRYYTRTRTNRTMSGAIVHETWINGSESLLRVDRPGEPVKYSDPNWSGTPGHPQKPVWDLRFGLASVTSQHGGDVTVEEQVRNESTEYVLSRTAKIAGPGSVTERTHTVSVREDGFIRRISVESISEPSSGEKIVSAFAVVFQTHPNRTVGPPEWTRAAREALSDDETGDED